MFKSMKTVLFCTNSAIILIVFATFVLFFYSWSTHQLREQAISTLGSFGESIQDQMVQQIEQLNSVSLNVLYSNLVKERFTNYMTHQAPSQGADSGADDSEGSDTPVDAPANHGSSDPLAPGGTLDDSSHPLTPGGIPDDIASGSADLGGNRPRASTADDAKVLTDALSAIIGPSRLAEQIYLYSFNGRYYGTGFDNREHAYTPEDKPFIAQLLRTEPGKLISDPNLDLQLSKYYSSDDGKYSISLYRLLYDEYNVPIGAVEVKQYAHRILTSAAEFQSNNPYNGQIAVLNKEGRVIYPFQSEGERDDALRQLVADMNPSADTYASIPFTDPSTAEKQLLSLHYSASTGWYTILTTSESDLFRPLRKFTFQLFGTAFALIALAIGLSFYAANRITLPLDRIRRAVRNLSFENIGSGLFAQQRLNSGFTELDELHDAFQSMSDRLKQSLDHLLLAEAQMMQSQLSALQSQMNPHFLYNTLANLQEMAAQQMNAPLIATIDHMSDFLRYITSKERQVPLRDELTHTVNYLEINKMRFGGRLTYRIAVPEPLLAQEVPKLCVQPLVENSIKYMSAHAPPWRIEILGVVTNDRWQIEVRDNGAGFDPGKLAELRDRLALLEKERSLPALELNGMGLLNIYLRLNLIYSEHKTFELYNLPEGGACVRIGGLLHKE